MNYDIFVREEIWFTLGITQMPVRASVIRGRASRKLLGDHFVDAKRYCLPLHKMYLFLVKAAA